MEKCFYSSIHKPTKWMILIGIVILLLLFLFGIYCLFFDIWLGIQVLTICFILTYHVSTLGLYLLREYSLSEAGITIRYPCRKQVFYPWSSVRKICLCCVHPGKGEKIEDQVIWCTIRPVKREPPNMARRWRDADYLCHFYKSILIIEFSEERLIMFHKYAKRSIPDYRDEVYR